MAEITYPTALKTAYKKLGAVYSLLEQMRLEHNRQGAEARDNPELIRDGKWAEYAKIFKEKQQPLLEELIRLRQEILEVNRPLWENLDNDDKIQAWLSILPDKQEEKSKLTEATSNELDELRLITLADLDGLSVPDPEEDFTSAGWNNGSAQADPNSRLTITASKVGCDSLTEDETMYFYRIHTVSGDFEWLFKLTHNGGANGGKVGMVTLGSAVGHIRASGTYFGLMPYGYTNTFSVQSWFDGENAEWDGYAAGGSVRYITMDRTGGILTAKFYTDAARTNLEDTLAISVTTNDMSYVYAAQSDNSGASSETISADLENLDLQEVSGAEKTSSENGAGQDARATGSPVAGITVLESGSGDDTATVLNVTTLAAESGTGLETSYLIAGEVTDKTGSDIGNGVEAMGGIVAGLAGFEAASGLEISTIVPMFFAGDSGLGSDFGILFKGTDSGDNGRGTDALRALIGGVGLSPDMRLPGRSGEVKVPSRKTRMPSKGVNI